MLRSVSDALMRKDLKTMYVYRFEGPDGIGPYNSQYKWSWNNGLGTHRPNMYSDIRDAPYDCDLYCGFTSWEQAIEWFDENFAQELYDNGNFELKIYEAEESIIFQGKKQCAFYRNRAILVDILTMEEVIQLY